MYLPGALAMTDPPEEFWILIAQRRRWINGSNASFLYVLSKSFKFARTEHSIIKRIFFILNFAI
jgi:chitin synthase